MQNQNRISRRAAVGTMALATASIVAADPVAAGNVLLDRRLAGRKKRRRETETLEELFWHNAVTESFQIEDYSWLESNERPESGSLKLLSVDRMVPQGEDEARPQDCRPCAISLLFKGRKSLQLTPASYRLSHRAYGTFDLLLSRTMTESGVVLYEAILN